MSNYTKISVVVPDRVVCVDDIIHSDVDLCNCEIPEDVWAFQWSNNKGFIEFTDARDNYELIGSDFPEWVNKCIQKLIEHDYNKKHPPPPTPEEIASNNKLTAQFLLEESDWAALSDTNLQNQSDWDTYRSAIRAIFLDPPQEEILSWPSKPEAIWV